MDLADGNRDHIAPYQPARSLSELVNVASETYGVEIPLADLFLWGGPKAATAAISSAMDIGPGSIGGVSCEQYIYRQPGADWQIWIQKGEHPLPRKLVITTTTDDARPQHVSVLTWNLAPAYNEAVFTFDPPAEAHRIVFGADAAAPGGPAN